MDGQISSMCAPSTLGPWDLVAFTMPPTPQGNPFFINGQAYSGACTAPYGVFLELARMHQASGLGVQELMVKRGSQDFGLKHYIEFTPTPLTCRLVKRSQKRAA